MAILVGLVVSPLWQTANASSCNSYDLFGHMMTDICWSCMFPIRIAGAPLGGTSASNSAPSGAATGSAVCQCSSNSSTSNFGFGFPFGMWQPSRIVEVVRNPYCSPVFGGQVLSGGNGVTSTGVVDRLAGGPSNGTNAHDSSDYVFYNYHYFAFPVVNILNLFTGCNPDGYTRFDLMYISELDATWNDDELAFFTNPEVTMVANPVAQAACIPDAIASTAGDPINSLFWCAGTWGGMYPFTGNVSTNGSPPRDTSLVVARALAALHRRGLAWLTMGNAAECGGIIFPTIPKTQYKLQQLFPLAEAKDDHWIGQSTLTWGDWRNIPGSGEDFVHMVWRWVDCCVPFF